jgi:SAM-dependent methyltransferase
VHPAYLSRALPHVHHPRDKFFSRIFPRTINASEFPMSGNPQPSWGSQYRLVAADKWKAKSAAMGQAVTNAIVEYAQPAPGMRVLDLASGTGEPAITLAARVGPTGHVTALDLSTELLEVATQRAQARGLQNFTAQQADAHSLPFPDNHFDLATSRFGIMFFRDPELALRELFRVLRPAARACFLVWGPFNQPYWQTTMGVVHQHVGGPLLVPDGHDPFRFSKPGSLSAVFSNAGFQSVEEETRTIPWVWPGGPDELWEYAQSVSVPFRNMLDRVRQVDWPQLNAKVQAAIQKYSDGNQISFAVSVVFASGKK